MTRKLSEGQITRDLGWVLRKRLVRSVIRELQRMGDCLLSGEDTCLANSWDEICIQQQLERSFSWAAYEATIEALIAYRVSQLQPYELDALWLLTGRGEDWDCELYDERETYPVLKGDVIAYLQDELLTEACNWSNERISQYLESRYDWDVYG